MTSRFSWLGVVLLAGLLLAACETGGPSAGGGAPADFNVTVQAKTAAHPYFGQGSAFGYVVDGVEGEELTLTRGTTYTFAVGASGHPFYITTSAVGGSGAPGEVTDGVDNSQTDDGVLTFTPAAATPSQLYYQCALHPNMGWRINIVD